MKQSERNTIKTSGSLKRGLDAVRTRDGWRMNVKREKKTQEIDILNCQFYKTGVAKVNCYHYRRRCCLSTSRNDHEKSVRR